MPCCNGRDTGCDITRRESGQTSSWLGYARRNFLVPIPQVSSWEELNAQLLERCRKRRKQRVWGHQETIGEAKVSSLSLVRYRANDYSVPTEYGHRIADCS